MTGIEPAFPPWKGGTLAIVLHSRGHSLDRTGVLPLFRRTLIPTELSDLVVGFSGYLAAQVPTVKLTLRAAGEGSCLTHYSSSATSESDRVSPGSRPGGLAVSLVAGNLLESHLVKPERLRPDAVSAAKSISCIETVSIRIHDLSPFRQLPESRTPFLPDPNGADYRLPRS